MAPHVGAAQRLYRQTYGDCLAFFVAELERGNDKDNLYHADGIAAALNDDSGVALSMLEIAR